MNAAKTEAGTMVPGNRAAENVWLNLACNAIAPGILLNYLSKPAFLGPVWGLVVALMLPIGYGIWDFAQRRTWNLFSVLGFVSTLLTGVLGLANLPGIWIAAKEAAIPSILGLAIPLSFNTGQPIVKTLLFNDQMMDTGLVQSALAERGNSSGFEALLRQSAWILAGSFFVSAILNFVLAKWLLTATPGTPEFNAQLGKMNMLSWPVIAIPSMAVMAWALFRLLKGVERLSGLSMDQIFRAGTPQNQKS